VLGKELERSRSPSVRLAAETAHIFHNQLFRGLLALTARSLPACIGRSLPTYIGWRLPAASQAINKDSTREEFKEDYFLIIGVSYFRKLTL